MTAPATYGKALRAEAGCDGTVNASASAQTAVTEMVFNMSYPFRVGYQSMI